jgi:REP element-mobilizing transposase RayT
LKNGWNETENKFHYVSVDKYVIMPNHIHAIIAIHNADGHNAGDFVGAALRGRPNNPHLTIEKGWNETENKFHYVSVDKYVIMPNHIHAILRFTTRAAATWTAITRATTQGRPYLSTIPKAADKAPPAFSRLRPRTVWREKPPPTHLGGGRGFS